MDNNSSSADQALYVSLLVVQLVSLIQQMYTDGKIIDLESYNQLYTAARTIDSQIQHLMERLEQKEKEINQ